MNASRQNLLQPLNSSGPQPAESSRWIERYRRSGLSQRTFAQRHGLPVSRLRYWLYHPKPVKKSPIPAPRLQEIQRNDWTSATPWAAEISLPDGWTVRLRGDFAREAVAALLDRS